MAYSLLGSSNSLLVTSSCYNKTPPLAPRQDGLVYLSLVSFHLHIFGIFVSLILWGTLPISLTYPLFNIMLPLATNPQKNERESCLSIVYVVTRKIPPHLSSGCINKEYLQLAKKPVGILLPFL